MFTETQMRDSLKYYTWRAWPQVEPSTTRPLIWGWHLDAICEHLEAAIAGQIPRLLIELPPNCTKTKLTGTFLPSWVWLRNPNYRWLFVGAEQGLASDESMTCRRLVESDWYRGTFGIPWRLRDDQDQKSWYINTAGGHRLCRGIHSNVTGRKGDCVLVDDANDAKKIHSAAERLRVNRSYDNSVENRVLDLVNGPWIIVAQRTGEDDLIGHRKAQGGCEVLTIPEEFDPKRRYVTCLGWTDPRKRKGELLRPKQFGPREVRTKRRNGLLNYLAQHQQTPRSAEGIRFKAKWFERRWKYDPDGVHVLLEDEKGSHRFHPLAAVSIVDRFGTADGAASAKTSADHTVISTWIITRRYDLVLFGCKRYQVEIPEQPDLLEAEYRRWSMNWCGVEAALSNRALLQFAQRRRMIIRAMEPGGIDKLARATPAIILAESGRVWLPDDDSAHRNEIPIGEIEAEITGFTGDPKMKEQDDFVDTFAYAVLHFNGVDASDASGPMPTVAPKPGATSWQNPGEWGRGAKNPFAS